jgi:DNA-binding phage protein
MPNGPKLNPSTAWDDFADDEVATDEDRRDYWRSRAKIEAASALAAAWGDAASRHNIARGTVAKRMHRHPSQITRLFGGMDGNPTLDTIVGASLATGIRMKVVLELVDDDANYNPLEIVREYPPTSSAARGGGSGGR